MQITDMGAHHARIREVRRALRSGTLTSDGWLVVEGPHLVGEARRSGIEIGEVFIRSDDAPPPGVESVYRLDAKGFRRLSATRNPQGPVALVRPPRFGLEDILRLAGRVVVLCGLQDPGNVGTILRLGEAFGCRGVVSIEPTVAFYNDKVVRASAGSLFRLPHVRMSDVGALRRSLRASGVGLVGTSPDGNTSVAAWDWTRPVAVLFGNEGAGLGPEERTLCDTILSIPCPGSVESLNTASAVAIVLYEASRAGS